MSRSADKGGEVELDERDTAPVLWLRALAEPLDRGKLGNVGVLGIDGGRSLLLLFCGVPLCSGVGGKAGRDGTGGAEMRLARQTGQEGFVGKCNMQHPACMRCMHGNRRHHSPDCIGSKQIQQCSSLRSLASVSRNIAVESETVRSLSLNKEIFRCISDAALASREANDSVSSSFTRCLRGNWHEEGASTSTCANVDDSLFHTSVMFEFCIQGYGM